MNSKKIWLLLLLIAMSYSVVHDYTIDMLDSDKCSVEEYVSEHTNINPDTEGDICDVHFVYHLSYICPIELSSLTSIKKEEDFFMHDELFFSWNNFNFFKPPIA